MNGSKHRTVLLYTISARIIYINDAEWPQPLLKISKSATPLIAGFAYCSPTMCRTQIWEIVVCNLDLGTGFYHCRFSGERSPIESAESSKWGRGERPVPSRSMAVIPRPWRQTVVPLDGVQKAVFGYLRTDACLDTIEEVTAKPANVHPYVARRTPWRDKL
jgi:hypothetical protein